MANYKWDNLVEAYHEWENEQNRDNAEELDREIGESSDGLLEAVSSYLGTDLKGWRDKYGGEGITPPAISTPIFTDSGGSSKETFEKKSLEEKIKSKLIQRKTKTSLKWLAKKIRKSSTQSEKNVWRSVKKARIKEEINKAIKIKERFRYHLRERAIGDKHKVPYNPRKIGGRSGAYKRPIWHLKAVKSETKALEKKYIESFRDKEVGKWSAKKIKAKKRKP